MEYGGGIWYNEINPVKSFAKGKRKSKILFNGVKVEKFKSRKIIIK
jgi:hypothetical protein